jgi:hypothetical protein
MSAFTSPPERNSSVVSIVEDVTGGGRRSSRHEISFSIRPYQASLARRGDADR